MRPSDHRGNAGNLDEAFFAKENTRLLAWTFLIVVLLAPSQEAWGQTNCFAQASHEGQPANWTWGLPAEACPPATVCNCLSWSFSGVPPGASAQGTVTMGAGVNWTQPPVGSAGSWTVTARCDELSTDPPSTWAGEACTADIAPDRAPVVDFIGPAGSAADGQVFEYFVGDSVSILMQVTDPDGDPATFSIENAPPGATLNPAGSLQWIPTAPGSWTVLFVARSTPCPACTNYPSVQRTVTIKVGPAIRLVGLETVQVIQDLEASVPLVTDKETWVRAYVESVPFVANGPAIPLQLRGLKWPELTPLSPPFAPLQTIKPSSDPLSFRKQWDVSANFKLPKGWLNGQVSLIVEGANGQRLDCATTTACGSVVEFVPVGTPEITLVGFEWNKEGVWRRVRKEDFHRLEARLLSIFPAAGFAIGAANKIKVPWPVDGKPDLDDVLAMLEWIATADNSSRIYYGFLPSFGDFEGVAHGSTVSTGFMPRNGFTLGRMTHAHEIAHNLGREHATHSVAGVRSYCMDAAGNVTSFDTACPPSTTKVAIAPRGFCFEGGSLIRGLCSVSMGMGCLGDGDCPAGETCQIDPADIARFDFPFLESLNLDDATHNHDPATNLWPTLGPLFPPESVVYGLDTRMLHLGRFAVVVPEEYFELMSYCSKGEPFDLWISKYTYEELLLAINQRWPPAGGGAAAEAAGTLLTTPHLVVRGVLSFQDGAHRFLPFTEVALAQTPPPPLSGSRFFKLVTADAQDNVLQEVHFAPSFGYARGPNPLSASFLVAVPADPAIRKVAVLNEEDEFLLLRVISPNSPTVSITSSLPAGATSTGSFLLQWAAADADGDNLTYTVQFSPDGIGWTTLVADWQQTEYDVPLGQLPRTAQGSFRVMASDGGNSAEAISPATFVVGNREPEVTILLPLDNPLVVAGETVSLAAAAEDPDDGELGGASFLWSSDLNGTLGAGTNLELNTTGLSPGLHTVTLTATDSELASGTDSVLLRISAAVPAALADLSLEKSAPEGPWLAADTIDYTLTVSNTGPDVADGVRVEDHLPPGVDYVASVADQGTCVEAAAVVYCDVGDVAAGAAVVITVQTTARTVGPSRNVAWITSLTSDPRLANNEGEHLGFADHVGPCLPDDGDCDDVSLAAGDCDDTDPTVHPGAPEICNGRDDNCDGTTDEGGAALCADPFACSTEICAGALGCQIAAEDGDGDGFFAPECGGADCNDTDASVWTAPLTVENVSVAGIAPTHLAWDGQSSVAGPGTVYDVISGTIDSAAGGFVWDGVCLATAGGGAFDDVRSAPPPGTAHWFLIRSRNACGDGDPGSPTREVLLPVCP